MDNKQRTEAGNALIQWFNSQEIPPSDAEAIMLKVMAKLILLRIDATRPTRNAFLDNAVEHNHLHLVHELNERLVYEARKRRTSR